MSDNKKKNSEYRSGEGSVLKTFGFTVVILFAPTVFMWFATIIHTLGEYGTPDGALVKLGGNLGFFLPVIGFFSAIVSSWFVIRILKMGDTFSALLQTIVITGGVLFVVFIAALAY